MCSRSQWQTAHKELIGTSLSLQGNFDLPKEKFQKGLSVQTPTDLDLVFCFVFVLFLFFFLFFFCFLVFCFFFFGF